MLLQSWLASAAPTWSWRMRDDRQVEREAWRFEHPPHRTPDRTGRLESAVDTLRQRDPEFVEAYIAFRLAPRKGGALSPVMRELILIAVNACTTRLYAQG